MADWATIREQYPALRNWTFLNSATYGQLSKRSQDAMMRHLQRRDELACTDFLSWFDDMDEVRRLVAQLVNCEASDVAFVSNAASALAILLGGLDWRTGDRVVTLKDEFPNNLYFPAMMQSRGVEFVETPWENFYDSITPNTRLVLMSALNYANGMRPPLAEVSAFLRSRGVLFYVDGTQGLGGIRIDLRESPVDMLAVHGYKWLLSPNGAGFACVTPELRERLTPNVIGWRSHKDWRSVDNLHHGAPEFVESAEKYEGGMLNFAELYAMGESIRTFLEIGPAVVEQRVLELAATVAEMMRVRGAHIAHENTPIVAACWADVDVSALARELAKRRIVVSARHGRLRVSVHLYNDESDIAGLAAELDELLLRR